MSFTCISCHVAFKDASIQRDHYKTDWHRYNLKRKVVELPPVTAEIFQQRVLEQRAQTAQAEIVKSTVLYCEFCRKKFGTEKSYQNHLGSKKHHENVIYGSKKSPSKAVEKAIDQQEAVEMDEEASEDEEMEEIDSDEWEEDEEPIAVTTCLFCNQRSETLEDNLKHMSLQHSFFIPDVEFVTNLEALLEYLGRRVGQGHMCLWCGHLGRQFPSAEAVQKHMLDKGHCRMYHEGEVLLEYTDFYDYSTSYPEAGDVNEEVELNVINDTGFELVLPSGAIVGHRSLNRYYRQKLNPNPRPPPPSRSAIRAGSQFKALGWTSSPKDIEKKARDMTFMRKVFTKNQLNLSVKANKLQKHFRQQVDF